MSTIANEIQVDVALRRVVLRDFDYRLAPLGIELAGPGVLLARSVDGIELLVRARDTGLEVLLRFDRSEFVNVATTALAMLDAADVTDHTEGR